jgi:hypothetical protein
MALTAPPFAQEVHLVGDQDSEFTLGLTFFTDKTKTTRVDLTGYHARLQLRATAAGPALVSLTDGSGITLGGAAGTVALVIADSAMGDLTADLLLHYSLQLQAPGHGWMTYLFGSFHVREAVTHG